MKIVICLLSTIISVSAFSRSMILPPQECGSANVIVVADVYSNSLDVKSMKVNSEAVEYVSSNLEANLRNGTIYSINYCPAGQSMSTSFVNDLGVTLIGCDIQTSLVVCE